MMVSLHGLIRNATRAIKGAGDGRGVAFELDTLLKNLRELKSRKAEGEKVLDEFFALYVLED